MKRTNKLYLDSEAYDLNLEPEKRKQNDFGTVTEKQVVSISALWARWEGDMIKFGRLDSFLGPEKNILENFFEQVGRYTPQLITFNGDGYDLAKFQVRAMVNGVDASSLLRSSHLYENYTYRFSDVHLDLFDVISRRKGARIGPLGLLTSLIGFPGKIFGKGADVQEMYEAGEIVKISEYNDVDAFFTAAVGLRWSFTTGELSLDGFKESARSFRNFLEAQAREKEHLARLYVEVDWDSFELSESTQNQSNIYELMGSA